MTLTGLIRDIGVLGLALQILLVITLLAKRTWRQFPFFTGYVWLSFAVSIAEYLLLRNRSVYFYVYWIGEAIGIGLGLFVVYEIFRHLFTVHGALLRLATITFRIAIGILLSGGFIVFLMQPPSHTSSLGPAIMAVEQATRVFEVGLLMFLFICSAAFGLHWKQAEFGVALGLGFFATVELLAVTVQPLIGTHGKELQNVMRVVAFDTSLFIWLGYLLAPPERTTTTVDVPKAQLEQAQLEQWNHAVMELINR
ncbi:hypothetical protein AYO50_00090 [Acidobacteria bacterium SCGC AG-212-P17]|nr:hypothetical protein AYO50_00090 [Acidobacteria bacterium SCGC AG-212-P17]